MLRRSINGMVNSVAKLGVDRETPFSAQIMSFNDCFAFLCEALYLSCTYTFLIIMVIGFPLWTSFLYNC